MLPATRVKQDSKLSFSTSNEICFSSSKANVGTDLCARVFFSFFMSDFILPD